MNSSISAIILGSNHHNTYGIIRSLAKAHIKPNVYIISDDGHCFYRKSRYVGAVKICKNESQLLHRLISSEESNGAVIIAASDAMAEFIDCNTAQLSSKFHLPGIKEHGHLIDILDKNHMASIAVQSGLNVPQTICLDKTCAGIESVKFPCVMKPINSIISTKNDLALCVNHQEVLSYVGNMNFDCVLAQQFIEKVFEYQIIGLSINGGETLITPGLTKLLCPTQSTTNTGVVLVEPIEKFDINMAAVQRFVKSVGYSGLFSMEFLRGIDGTDYFLEMNFRNDGNTISMLNSGVNLPLAWVHHCYNRPFVSTINQCKRRTTMPLFPFLRNVIERKISFHTFMSYFFQSTCFMDATLADPFPILARILKT